MSDDFSDFKQVSEYLWYSNHLDAWDIGNLAKGARFWALYAPTPTVSANWQLREFEVGSIRNLINKQWERCYFVKQSIPLENSPFAEKEA